LRATHIMQFTTKFKRQPTREWKRVPRALKASAQSEDRAKRRVKANGMGTTEGRRVRLDHGYLAISWVSVALGEGAAVSSTFRLQARDLKLMDRQTCLRPPNSSCSCSQLDCHSGDANWSGMEHRSLFSSLPISPQGEKSVECSITKLNQRLF